MRGLIDRKGEQFAYLEDDVLYTLDGEMSGRLENGFILDQAGHKIWRVLGDGVYTLDFSETIGYLSTPRQSDPY
jgi:hypothetical protein